MPCVRRMRTVTVTLPSETGRHYGLAYTLWLPDRRPARGAGVVILHGADSSKESHHDYARLLSASGIGALCFDQRGHGDSDGALDDRAAHDVTVMADLLRDRLGEPAAPIGLRGSSMGGYMAIVAADSARAQAVVAICPAPAELLRAGLERRAFAFRADAARLGRFLDAHDLTGAASRLTAPLLLLHAEGDERVPVAHSRELAEFATAPGSRLIALPGGHHRSIQHDRELQAVSLRFLQRALGLRADAG